MISLLEVMKVINNSLIQRFIVSYFLFFSHTHRISFSFSFTHTRHYSLFSFTDTSFHSPFPSHTHTGSHSPFLSHTQDPTLLFTSLKEISSFLLFLHIIFFHYLINHLLLYHLNVHFLWNICMVSIILSKKFQLENNKKE